MDFEIDRWGRLRSYHGSDPIVRIPDGVTEICDKAFADNETMKELVIPEGVTRVGTNAFALCRALEKVTLPDSLQKIGKVAFQVCRSLKEVHLGNGVQVIDEAAFYRCFALEKIDFPPTLRTLGQYAFRDCDLEEVILPEGLENIGMYCFYECSKLKKVHIPSTVRYVETGVFTNCGNDLQIEVAEDNPELKGAGCNLLSKDGTELLNSACSDGTWHVPDGVEIIGQYALHTSRITGVVMPDTVRVIGRSAFEDCTYLTDIKLSQQLSEIQDGAFVQCEELAHINLPDSLKRIEDGAFTNTEITELELPESVEEVGFCILSVRNVHRFTMRGNPAPIREICSPSDLDEDAELIADALPFEAYPVPFRPVHGLRGYARRLLDGQPVPPAAAERFETYLQENEELFEVEPLLQRLLDQQQE